MLFRPRDNIFKFSEKKRKNKKDYVYECSYNCKAQLHIYMPYGGHLIILEFPIACIADPDSLGNHPFVI